MIRAALAEPMPIRNDSIWVDNAGNEVRAQGGSILKEGETYYWYGFDGDGGEVKHSKRLYRSVRCYSSKDLSTWKYEGIVFDEKDRIPNRMDVVRSPATGTYVMLSKHMDAKQGVGVSVSDTPTGKFTWHGWMKLPDSLGGGDQSVFVDDDGKIYLVYTPWNINPKTTKLETNRHLTIVELTPDLMAVARIVCQLKDTRLEAPCLLKRKGKYYWFNSQVHWWYSSPTSWSVATKLEGPWAPMKRLASSLDPTHPLARQLQTDGYNTQVDFILPVRGSEGSFFIFCGDRYSNYTYVGASRVAWFPLGFAGGTPQLDWLQTWYVDTTKGTWSEKWDKPPAQPSYEPIVEDGRPKIYVDRIWRDEDGNEIQAQGGDVIQTKHGFLWYGVAYEGDKPKEVRCYSSQELVKWKLQGTVLPSLPGRFVRALECNGKITLLVMDGARVRCFSSRSIANGFSPAGEFELPGVTEGGAWSLFTDDDGKWYVTYPTVKSVVIALLAMDFSGVTPVHTFAIQGKDAPCLVKQGGVYSCIVGNIPDSMRMSAGVLEFSAATRLQGAWSEWKKLNGGWERATVVPNTVFRVRGERGRQAWISAGERYTQLSKYGAGNYAWMPFFFHPETQSPSLFWIKPWNVDLNAENLGINLKEYYAERKVTP